MQQARQWWHQCPAECCLDGSAFLNIGHGCPKIDSLACAGTEALFADMGHFNRPSIQLSTLALVYPALMITYLGQV